MAGLLACTTGCLQSSLIVKLVQVENQVKKIDEKTVALASQVQQLQTDMGQIQSDVGEILRLLKHKPAESLPLNEFT